MNKDKITVSEIVDLMAAKNNFSKKQTEEFVKTLLSTIEDVLIDGDVVKMKDFGTFKPQWNEPRKSVDVNTGEEIIVPGYYKVVFVPDNDFKELINKPFAHLLPIEQKQNFSNNKIEENDVDYTEKKDSSEDKISIDNVRITQEPMRVFEEQAAQIKGLLSEITALSGTKKRTVKEETSVSFIQEIQPTETDKKEQVTEKEETNPIEENNSTSEIENEITEQTSDITEENKEETKTTDSFNPYEDRLSRKQRKKQEKEEQKQRRREEIKRYFDENQFNVVREIHLDKAKAAESVVSLESEKNQDEIIPENISEETVEKINEINDFTPVESEVSEIQNENSTEQVVNHIQETSETVTETETETIQTSEIDRVDDENQVSEIEKESIELNQNSSSGENIASTEQPNNEVANEQTDLQQVEAIEPLKEDVIENPEEKIEEPILLKNDNLVVENKNTVIEGEIQKENPSSDNDLLEAPKIVSEEQTESKEEDVDYTFTPIRKRSKRWLWFIILPLLIAGLVYGVWMFFPQIKPYIKPYIEKFIPQHKEQVVVQKTIIIAKKVIVDTTALNANDTTGLNEIFNKERDYKEFLSTSEVTTKEKDIRRIAKDYYGNDAFWIYIYEANNEIIEDPKNIPVGTPIKIPKLDPRLINVNNPECIKLAKKLTNDYLRN